MKYGITVVLCIVSFWLYSQSVDYKRWIERSADFIELNQLDSAAFALRKAMSMEPANKNNGALLLNLGILQRQLKQPDDAYVSMTASLANSPDSVLVLHNRASLLCDMGRFEDALDDYTAILRIHPENIEAYYRRGLLFLEKNNRAKAQADFMEAEKRNPNHLFTKLSKALLFKLDGDWNGAEKIYTELIESNDAPNSSFYLNRAECYVYTQQFAKAIVDLRAAEPREKSNPYFYFLRGRIRLNQFDKLAAKEDFIKAKSLGYDADMVDEWLNKVK